MKGERELTLWDRHEGRVPCVFLGDRLPNTLHQALATPKHAATLGSIRVTRALPGH
jgi:hypothetical protein